MNYLASYPRSGRNMVRIAMSQIGGHYIAINEDCSDGTGVDKLMRDDHEPETYGFLALATHALIKPKPEDNVVVLVRDPRDVIVSYAHELVRNENCDFIGAMHFLIDHLESPQGWATFYKHYLNLRGETNIIKYEEIIAGHSIIFSLRHMLRVWNRSDGLILEGKKAEDSFKNQFKTSHEANPGFFRKGQIGAYKQEMPPEAVAKVNKICEHYMEIFNYETG